MQSSNPVLRENVFSPQYSGGFNAQLNAGAANVMTINGTIVKTGILLFLCIVSALFAANSIASGSGLVPPQLLLLGGSLGGFIVAMIISFAPKTAPFLAPLYALLEGAVLGAVSLLFTGSIKGQAVNGIVIEAVFLTFGIFAAMLGGFAFGFVRAGSTMTKCIVIGTLGVCLTTLLAWILSMFGVHSLMSAIYGSGLIGIGFSLVVIVLASLNLVLDFQRIESGVRQGAPKYMEWYAGFGLLVTLVWLYLEILRLLSKLNRRD